MQNLRVSKLHLATYFPSIQLNSSQEWRLLGCYAVWLLLEPTLGT
jgi:hypothetical protein